MTAPARPVAALRVPAHIRPYVDVLGVDGAVEFLLTFGGGYTYFSTAPDAGSPVAKAIGVDRAAALAEAVAGTIGRAGSTRVPTAKPFIARLLKQQGHGVSAIARRLHMSDVTVRKWLTEEAAQLSLPLDPAG